MEVQPMFNVLITADETAWESEQRMSMLAGRFLEYSGDEGASISVNDPDSLRVLERAHSILMYEAGVSGSTSDIVRVGHMRDIRVRDRKISFRFAESGRI